MRRTTRKALTHLFLFGCALFSIIYLTHPQSNSKYFAWNKVRYETSAAILPELRGICPDLAKTSKPALVVGRVSSDGDPEWLHALGKLYHVCIYTADAPTDATSTYLQVPANRGHEAMAYLTFLIDNYDNIPAAGAVFVHGSRRAWHNDSPDYDNAALLAALNVSVALEPWGYHNLRCDWSLSMCPASMKPQGHFENSAQAVISPWDARASSDAALPGAFVKLFGGAVKLGSSDAVRAQCCAQFVVAREQIWQHYRDEYVALRQWLLDDDGAPRDDQ
ncbi:hypothetical protein LSUE1_G005926 [Lachnellula suecica]|uniref:Uncharacterized protein n=1 Tax=Lachnellula suecica TaxID=602035 RepID=A0A8T9C6T1_9HELO|nr:hypothetical protein LSUE1_G005926 [Lachnellula suecica]